MLSNLEVLFSRMGDAGYLYLLLEPLLLHGILFGVIFFCVGHFLEQPKCRAAALIVIGLCSLSIIPCLSLRSQAMHPRELERRPSDARLIKEQFQRRADSKWIYYALAIASVLALLGGGKLAAFSNVFIIAGGLATIIFSTWMHMKEAEIYHPNIIQRAVPVLR